MARPRASLCLPVWACLLVAACLLLPLRDAMASPVVHAARIGEHGEVTRFVLETDRPLDGHLFYLQNPDRIVLDLPEAEWELSAADGDAMGGFTGRGVIRAFRYGLFQPGTSRLVLDLARPATVARQFLLQPAGAMPHYRFVLDLEPADRTAFGRAAGSTAPKVQRAAIPAPAVKPRGDTDRQVVVIDAGHGGVDPGAIGISGLHEKDVTLAVAIKTANLLRRSGRYDVYLTRDRDVFLKLRERVAIARARGADLFVSIHADSVGDPSVRGGAVYTLSETASDKEAAALAAQENKADLIAGVDLGGENDDVASILIDLVQRDTKNRSAEMASFTVDELRQQARVRTRPHRFAGFRVLKAPDVPSVLVELGFMSNRDDEAMLRGDAGQLRLARAIAAAIDRFLARREAAVRQ
ncbi:N-acetylmuramoyl-L-alanine amidase [Marinibaculum pumilum]|uniref:N-acetylmuramoyl-L-alanine amidase n=1 Tax=Marinibaculum pumilum TaxID=1766165 RepID=A0ABV7KX60_9PROT